MTRSPCWNLVAVDSDSSWCAALACGRDRLSIQSEVPSPAFAHAECGGSRGEGPSGSNITSLRVCCSFIMDDTRKIAMIPKTTADPLETILT
eukprot:CAMPEP_0172171558 /NCGR_PEP_ID=MMETSP1050-20130122/11958_2 /TAXON_ID=233186 /ORGANISM="Cryptomonas curvata, Strain CCAP979/52" /LENGTH=91 /DNA_ID=CAMNT_0012843001 /DNA_START=62 /DNA_END=333 /DNA_ORIENTATION=-